MQFPGCSLAAGCLLCSFVFAEDFELTYPETRTVPQMDDFHGTKVADPYRWLEEDVRENKDVAAWVEAQNEVTFGYLRQIPQRESIEKRITQLWNYERLSAPTRAGGRYYYFRNDGLQNQSVLYMQQTLDDDPIVLLDPNTWSDDGTVALASVEFSDDGRYVAYGIQDGGSDWRTWKVMDIRTRQLMPDKLEWVKFSDVAWTPDSRGFFYARYDAPKEGDEFQSLNLNQKVYYHIVGTSQAEDRTVYQRSDHPDWGFGISVSEDGKYLIISVWKGTDDRYRIIVDDLTRSDEKPFELIDNFDYEYTYVGNNQSLLYFQTNRDAPRRRVIGIDLRHPEVDSWKEIIPQTANTLTGIDIVGGQFLAVYLEDAKTQVRQYSLDGKHVRNVELPGIGSASGFRGNSDHLESFYSFSSFATPPSTYRFDVATGESTLLSQANVDFDPANYHTSQVFYESKDGTQIPMFITHRTDLKLDGANPVLLYGYGGFNIPLTPRFSVSRLAWMEMGGVFAMPNLRGGGEYGESWHKAGTRLQKQNVFDDFIAAAEWLIKSKYTTSSRLAIQGGSNGGLLVGACMTQRPDLYAACLPAVGVMDMLRFHQFTAGRFWVDDYGSAEDPAEFQALLAYSPLQNLTPGVSYPATLITTADTDDRVVPGHSFKFAAMLQKCHRGRNPVLIRIETRAGHGAGKPTAKLIEEIADQWAFLIRNLQMSN
ncbi:MAG: prolyl oligopeptidase family serine peptidase [Fuerstiella sp.]|nr:prolyl oligopeptidase family serine peptidase [Fuerstiella sp.]